MAGSCGCGPLHLDHERAGSKEAAISAWYYIAVGTTVLVPLYLWRRTGKAYICVREGRRQCGHDVGAKQGRREG